MRTTLALTLAALAGCASEPPPKAPAESAPIRETQALPAGSAPAAIPVVSASVAPIPPDPAPPAPAASGAAAPAATGSAGPPKAGALTEAQCDKVIHRFAELVASGQGGQLMEGFQNAPVYRSMIELCVQQTTRQQYDCAMAAKTMQKWQECMK